MKTLFLILVLSFFAFGQKKIVKKSVVPRDTILYEVLKNLAAKNVCGMPQPDGKEIYSGSIVKRSFNDSAVALNGFVLADAKDRRTFINFDDDYISGRAASASRALSDYLIKGVRVKVFAYRCGHIYYAYKIQPI